MKFRLPLWFLLPALVTLSPAAEKKPAPIRAFDVATLSRLGREIYQHDQLAWIATDVVMAQVGLERLQKDGGRGWVVDTSNPKSPVVRFLRSGVKGPESLCDVIFSPNRTPELSVPEKRELTASQRAHAEALETAKARFAAGDLAWCGGNPNTVVLDDPDGSGFLVYFLRAKPAVDQIPVGGHYRFTVSKNGKKIEAVDRLFVSCLTMSKNAPNGATTEMIVMSHIVSPTPLETHVFLSLQEKLPFLVTTTDGMAWRIERGEIKAMGLIEDLQKKQSSGASNPEKSSKKK